MSFEKRAQVPALFFLQATDARWLRFGRRVSNSWNNRICRLWMRRLFWIETLFLVNIRKILYNNKAV
ncbi:hypothetical protein DI291_13130 [Bacillus paralicheniformis]|nr:hypothetical protein DI291_13130 [Bacillus paralicheniformis]